MSDALTQKKAAAGHAALLSRVLREGAAIAVGMAALVLAVALLSFHAGDPGFSSTGSGEPVRNLIGVAGAWVADLLLPVEPVVPVEDDLDVGVPSEAW